MALAGYIGTSSWGATPGGGWVARQNSAGNENYAIELAVAATGTTTGPTINLAGSGGAVKSFILAIQSVAVAAAVDAFFPAARGSG
jgi:hypothetical protein